MRYLLIFLLLFHLICAPSRAEPADPKAYLQMIFEDKGGYTLPIDEASAIFKEGGHPQYGEIPYDSAAHILDDLQLSRQDVFYDLGSGVGKLVLQVYLTTPVKRSVGVELSLTRWKIAEESRTHLATDYHIIPGRDLSFLNQNILKSSFTDATVCFISGITFPPQLIQFIMDRLSTLGHDVKVISVLPLPAHKDFRLVKTYNLPMSWASEGVDVCLYQVTPASQADSSPQPRKGKRRKKQRILEDD